MTWANAPLGFPIPRRPWTIKPPLGAQLDWSHPLTQGLEACYLFNEGQGTTLHDLTGRGHNVTIGLGSGDTLWTQWVIDAIQGIPGHALLGLPEPAPGIGGVDPVNGNMARPIVLPQGRDWAVEFWVYRTNILPVNASFGPILYSAVAFYYGTGFIQYSDASFSHTVAPLSLQWNHIVWVKRVDQGGAAGARLEFYLNGQRVSPTANTIPDTAISWNKFLRSEVPDQIFTGKMGVTRIWTRALAWEDVRALYQNPYDMIATQSRFYRNQRPPIPPAQMQWAVQAPKRVYTIPAVPAQMGWEAKDTRYSGRLLEGVIPARMQWRASPVARVLVAQPAQMKWRAPQQELPIGFNLRDCGEFYENALQQDTISGDWLIQAPAIGLKVSFNYEGGGGWEHRIVDISDIEISAPPGGGITSAANVTVSIAENQTGQSILQLWEAASTVGAVEVTIDFLLRGAGNALRIYTGHIDSIVTKDAISQLLLVDDSIRKNLLLPKDLVTTAAFPNADQGVLTRPVPLIYGQGSLIGAAPLLYVDVTNNTYLVANHPMLLGGKLAVYDQPTQAFLTLDSIVVIPNNGTATIGLGTVDTGVVRVWRDDSLGLGGGLAIDGNSTTPTIVATALAGPLGSLVSLGDGWGRVRWGYTAPGTPLANTIKIDITNHRRRPGSDPTTTGQFVVRTVDANNPLTIESRRFFLSPAFNHVTSAQNNTFIVSNINVGINEILDVAFVARCQGTIGNASQLYEIGEISITPLVAFSANVSGNPTAIGVPINIQELRFNRQVPTLSIFLASGITNPTLVIDNNSNSIVTIPTTTLDSNLDGIGELIVTADVTSAQRSNNTVSIDLARHRRGLSSTPTVTGTFAVQTYNTNTGVLIRDNLFVTQAFRHQLNPISTSYVATAINLGTTTTLAVRVVARNEGGVGSAGQVYEVGEIGMETFYQPRGDSGDVYLYGAGYEGRTDLNGDVVTYIGSTPGRLYQTPDMVIASILIDEISSPIDLPSFATAYNYFSVHMLRFDGGIGAGWAVEQGNARDILDQMARQSASILFPAFDDSWGLRPFRVDQIIHQTFDAHSILTEYGAESRQAEERNSTMQLTLGNLQHVHNHLEVRYKYNVGSRKYDKVYKVTKDGSNLPDNEPEKAAVEATCLSSWVRYGDLDPLIIEANWIADDTTAVHLLVHLALYFSQERITAQFETTFKAACLQVGDFITITDTSLPSGDNGGTFEVHTIRYIPMRGRIQLTASRVSQIPDVTIPDPAPAAVGCARAVISGLIACWDFDEASGTRTDHITGLTLTEVNGPILGVPGKVGNAIRFAMASNQYLTNPQALIGAMTGAFTIACWVRRQGVSGTWQTIAANVHPTLTNVNREFFLGLDPVTAKVHIGCGVFNVGGVLTSTNALPFTGASTDWTLIRVWRTFTSTQSGVLSLQIDNGTVETVAFGPAQPLAFNNFTMGACNTGGGAIGFFADLEVDQFQVYNRVLSQTELDAIWNGGTG